MIEPSESARAMVRNHIYATVLDSIPAFFDKVKSEGRHG